MWSTPRDRHPGDYALVHEIATGALYRAEPESGIPAGFVVVEPSLAHLPQFWALHRLRFRPAIELEDDREIRHPFE